jgi:hypothetical protein
VGNREDLTDMIYRITPTDTPFMSMIGKGKATATKHEWQTQALATPANNVAAEGDDATAAAVTATVRLSNYTQISTKTVSVSGSQEAVTSAGRKSEMGYQMMLKSLELRNDMEVGLTQNNVAVTGASRQARGWVGWQGDNVDAGAGYVAPNYVTNVAQTDGTQAAFTEARLKNVLQKVYTAGGNPSVIMLPPLAKQTFSTFTGNSTRFDKGEDKQLTAALEVYVSDFGELKTVPNRRMRTREVAVLQPDMWSVAYLRPFATKDLAVTGDSTRKQIVVEYTLEAKNPAANGAVVDIS